jgi:hypothetical protein
MLKYTLLPRLRSEVSSISFYTPPNVKNCVDLIVKKLTCGFHGLVAACKIVDHGETLLHSGVVQAIHVAQQAGN